MRNCMSLVLLLFAVGTSAQETPPPPQPVVLPTVAQVPKYSVGDSWTVKLADGRTQTRKVRAIERDQYVFEWGLDLVRYYDRELILRRQITPENGKDFPSYLEKQRAMNFPLSVNKNWDFRILISKFEPLIHGTRYYYRVYSSNVLGTETIQIPAGTFGAFKVEDTVYEILCLSMNASNRNCNTLPNTTTVRDWWYSPEVKFPVKMMTRVKGPDLTGQEPDYELTAYELK